MRQPTVGAAFRTMRFPTLKIEGIGAGVLPASESVAVCWDSGVSNFNGTQCSQGMYLA